MTTQENLIGFEQAGIGSLLRITSFVFRPISGNTLGPIGKSVNSLATLPGPSTLIPTTS